MISVDALREFRPKVTYRDGSNVTLKTVQAALENCSMNMGVPVAFKNDQVKSGGFFNKTIEDCIVLYHPDHANDYFNFCIRVSRQGNYAIVSVNDFGTSKQMQKAGQVAGRKSQLVNARDGFDIVGGMVGMALSSIGKSKAKLEEEQNYYTCIMDMFDQIVS